MDIGSFSNVFPTNSSACFCLWQLKAVSLQDIPQIRLLDQRTQILPCQTLTLGFCTSGWERLDRLYLKAPARVQSALPRPSGAPALLTTPPGPSRNPSSGVAPLKPEHLQVFETLEEITGGLSVLASFTGTRSSGPFYIPSPLLCLQVTYTFQHGQRASKTSVSSRTFGSFGDGFSMSKWEEGEARSGYIPCCPWWPE